VAYVLPLFVLDCSFDWYYICSLRSHTFNIELVAHKINYRQFLLL
jgi:hypothetical protein